MKESIGYSVTINIMITFIIIIFSFLASAIVYFKANKASNIIVDTIQKYEGYNKIAKNEIIAKLEALGYGKNSINCKPNINGESSIVTGVTAECTYTDPNGVRAENNRGFCVYRCVDKKNGKVINDYYYYKIRINMMINVPVVGSMLDIPIYTSTDRIYNFTGKFGE